MHAGRAHEETWQHCDLTDITTTTFKISTNVCHTAKDLQSKQKKLNSQSALNIQCGLSKLSRDLNRSQHVRLKRPNFHTKCAQDQLFDKSVSTCHRDAQNSWMQMGYVAQ